MVIDKHATNIVTCMLESYVDIEFSSKTNSNELIHNKEWNNNATIFIFRKKKIQTGQKMNPLVIRPINFIRHA